MQTFRHQIGFKHREACKVWVDFLRCAVKIEREHLPVTFIDSEHIEILDEPKQTISEKHLRTVQQILHYKRPSVENETLEANVSVASI